MKKIISLILATMMMVCAFSLMACSNKDPLKDVALADLNAYITSNEPSNIYSVTKNDDVNGYNENSIYEEISTNFVKFTKPGENNSYIVYETKTGEKKEFKDTSVFEILSVQATNFGCIHVSGALGYAVHYQSEEDEGKVTQKVEYYNNLNDKIAENTEVIPVGGPFMSADITFNGWDHLKGSVYYCEADNGKYYAVDLETLIIDEISDPSDDASAEEALKVKKENADKVGDYYIDEENGFINIYKKDNLEKPHMSYELANNNDESVYLLINNEGSDQVIIQTRDMVLPGSDDYDVTMGYERFDVKTVILDLAKKKTKTLKVDFLIAKMSNAIIDEDGSAISDKFTFNYNGYNYAEIHMIKDKKVDMDLIPIMFEGKLEPVVKFTGYVEDQFNTGLDDIIIAPNGEFIINDKLGGYHFVKNDKVIENSTYEEGSILARMYPYSFTYKYQAGRIYDNKGNVLVEYTKDGYEKIGGFGDYAIFSKEETVEDEEVTNYYIFNGEMKKLAGRAEFINNIGYQVTKVVKEDGKPDVITYELYSFANELILTSESPISSNQVNWDSDAAVKVILQYQVKNTEENMPNLRRYAFAG